MHDTIERIYDLGLGEGWPPILAELTGQFDSTYAVLTDENSLDGAARVVASAQLPPQRQIEYESYYAPKSLLLRHFRSEPVRAVFTDSCYPDLAQYRRSEIYNDFFRPVRGEHMLCCHLSSRPDQNMSVILRRGRDSGAFSPKEVRRFSALVPHLQNILRLQRRLEGVQDERSGFLAAFDRLAVGIIVADGRGRVLHMNAKAEALVRQGDGLRLAHGVLLATDSGDTQRLRHLMRRTLESLSGAAAPHGMVTITRTSERLPLRLSASALPVLRAFGEAVAGVVVFVWDAEMQTEALQEKVVLEFALTPAEARVVAALAVGETVAGLAARLGVSIHTVRTLLKRAQEKTGAHRQADLVRLTLTSTTGPL